MLRIGIVAACLGFASMAGGQGVASESADATGILEVRPGETREYVQGKVFELYRPPVCAAPSTDSFGLYRVRNACTTPVEMVVCTDLSPENSPLSCADSFKMNVWNGGYMAADWPGLSLQDNNSNKARQFAVFTCPVDASVPPIFPPRSYGRYLNTFSLSRSGLAITGVCMRPVTGAPKSSIRRVRWPLYREVLEIDVVGSLADSLPGARMIAAATPASASPAASRPARTASPAAAAAAGPNLDETLGWLTKVLNSAEHTQSAVTVVRNDRRWRFTCEIESATFKDGQLILRQERAEQVVRRGENDFRHVDGYLEQLSVALADLDPTVVRASAYSKPERDSSGKEVERPFHWTVLLTARNEAKVVELALRHRDADGVETTEDDRVPWVSICVNNEPIANRMVNAFRRAIELSGGRASAGEVF